MVNPKEARFEQVTRESAQDPLKRGWTRFHEEEIIEIRGTKFRVHEIGETRMVLKLVKQ